jgi:hypothetical protein
MSELVQGVYKQVGQPDVILPLLVDSTGVLQTTGGGGGVASEVTVNNTPANPVPVEPLGIPTVARQITVTATSTNTQLTAGVKRISIKARTSNLRYAVGATAQTASATTSHFIEAGERLDIAVPAGGYIAVIRDTLATADGILCITELG